MRIWSDDESANKTETCRASAARWTRVASSGSWLCVGCAARGLGTRTVPGRPRTGGGRFLPSERDVRGTLAAVLPAGKERRVDEDSGIARLDGLLVIAQELRRLGVARLIDQRCPRDPRSRVSHGQCVEALIAAILLGTHTLYHIFDTLEPYDLEVAFGWPGAVAHHFHDDRLASAMDATFDAGVITIASAALLRAVEVHDLDTRRIHLDTTSVSTYGEYASSAEPADPEDPQAIPHVARGHSKDNHPELKQIVYGIAVTADGAVPFFGRTASGNRTDVCEIRFLFEQMLPRNTSLWGDAFRAYRDALTRGENVLIFKEVCPEAPPEGESGPPEPVKEWVGMSFDMTYRWEDEKEKLTHELPVRLLVVESSTLRAQRAASAEGRRRKEREKLDHAVARLATRAFSCEDDAREAADDFRAKHGPDFHVLSTQVVTEQRVARRSRRGRPRSDEAPSYETVWRVSVEIDGDDEILEEVIFRESCYVLVTTLPRTGPEAKSDLDVFNFYREQNSVEGAIRWAKQPLAVGPLFLKTRERIAALGLVYVLALMTYALIQRHVRARLQATGRVFPGNRGVTRTPTTEVVFRLFEGLETTRVGGQPVVSRITTAQLEFLKLLEHPVLDDSSVRFAAPRESGRPRERSYWNWRQAHEHASSQPDNSDEPREIS